MGQTKRQGDGSVLWMFTWAFDNNNQHKNYSDSVLLFSVAR